MFNNKNREREKKKKVFLSTLNSKRRSVDIPQVLEPVRGPGRVLGTEGAARPIRARAERWEAGRGCAGPGACCAPRPVGRLSPPSPPAACSPPGAPRDAERGGAAARPLPGARRGRASSGGGGSLRPPRSWRRPGECRLGPRRHLAGGAGPAGAGLRATGVAYPRPDLASDASPAFPPARSPTRGPRPPRRPWAAAAGPGSRRGARVGATRTAAGRG